MPFDGSGNFSRVHDWTDDRDAGIKIRADRMDQEFDDMASAFNVVFFRNGLVPMTGDLDMGSNDIKGVATGTAIAPSIQFASDPNTGIFLNGANKLGFSSNGSRRLEVNTSGVNVVGNLDVSLALTANTTLAVTGATTLTGAVVAESTLAVTGTATFNGLGLFENTVNYNGTVLFNANVFMDTGDGQIFFNNTDGVTQAAIVFQSLGVTDHQIRITAAGNLDFTTPTAKEVHISGSRVLTVADTGTGNALDADLLDGQEGAYYADIPARLGYTPVNTVDYTAADVLAKLITVDGSGSGLDADTLDSLSSAAYAKIASSNAFTAINSFGATSAEPLAVVRTSTSQVAMKFEHTAFTMYFGLDNTGKFRVAATSNVNAGDRILTTADEGSGNGIDADTVDGVEAAGFAQLAAAGNIFANPVGIGTTTTLGEFHVEDAAGNVNVNFTSATTGITVLGLGDTADNDAGAIWYSNADNSMRLYTNAAERMRIDSAGKVGIGATSILGKLHVESGDSSGTIQAKTNVMIENNSDAGITISTPAANQGAICFGDNGAAGAGRIIYDHPSDSMQLYTNGAVRTTITAAGNLSTTGSISDSLGTVRSIPRLARNGTLVVTDVGQCNAITTGATIPASVFAAGDAVSIYNNSASPVTITQGAGLTLRNAGTADTGNRTLAARGIATVWFNSATEAIISGAGLS